MNRIKSFWKAVVFLAAASVIAVSCSKPESGKNGGGDDSGGGGETPEAATVKLSPASIELGGSMFDRAEVSVSTNRTTITPVSNNSWMNVKMMGRILIVTAIENNESGSPREGSVTVTAGQGDDIATAVLSVTQRLRDSSTEVPAIELDGTPDDLAANAGSETSVSFRTNQSEVSVNWSEPVPDWVSASISGNTVTFKALSSNSTGAIRSAEANLVAGTESRNASVSVVVRQISGAPQGITPKALYDGGMIFEIAADYIKIVSIDEVSCYWSQILDQHAGTEPNPTEGAANTALLSKRSDFDQFPAASWCVAKGSGWYLPSRIELNTLVNSLGLNTIEGQESTNTILALYGGTPFTVEAPYWSSCEHASEMEKVWTVRLNDKNHAAYFKNGSIRPARAIKKIEMDVAGQKTPVDGGLGDFIIIEDNWE